MVDKFSNNNDGLDDVDVSLACNKLGLENDPEFIQIRKDLVLRMNNFLEARKVHLDSMKEKISELKK